MRDTQTLHKQYIQMSSSMVCLEDFELQARGKLEKNALDYYKSGAGEQTTLANNRNAFKRLRLRQRFLRDISKLDISCEIFGQKMQWPLGIAPAAMQKMAHPDGEIGNARAAGSVGSIYILSTLSTTSIEELAAAVPETCKWFQLYIYKDRSITENLIRRVEKANFKALVLTIDAPVFGNRRADERNSFSLPSHLTLANFQGEQASGVMAAGASGISKYVSDQFDPTLTWKDIKWLKTLTNLPIVVKGVLTAEDAILAREFGCAGVLVSNHGARQIDTAPASIEALPSIAKAVGNDIVVMLDGGVLQGSDIFKALALGAKTVFIGRPPIWALACDGERGVKKMLNLLKKDFETTMALVGCPSLKDISPSMVVHESTYAKL